jgi:hypothetical protein
VLHLRVPRLFENLAPGAPRWPLPAPRRETRPGPIASARRLGTHSLNDQQRLGLLEIFEERYRRKSTLITAQLPSNGTT